MALAIGSIHHWKMQSHNAVRRTQDDFSHHALLEFGVANGAPVDVSIVVSDAESLAGDCEVCGSDGER